MDTQNSKKVNAPRFFVYEGDPSSGQVLLSPSDSHHAKDVLRLESGDDVILLFKDSPRAFRGEIANHSEQTSVTLGEELESIPHLSETDTVIFALSKGKKNDLVCEKATELGVSNIIFWQAERSIVKIANEKDREKKVTRWEKIAESAAKQCHRITLPEILLHTSLNELIDHLRDHKGTKLCCSLSPNAIPIQSSKPSCSPSNTVVVVGPEGDLTANEEKIFKENGFQLVGLGPNILRSETAAIVVIAMVEALFVRNNE